MTEAFDFTIFPDRYALQAYRQHATLEEIAALIAETVRPSKNKLPLIKLAVFGTKPSPEGCLRHDANVQQITGLEGDYDGEKIGLDEAVAIAKAAGLRALLYTSPSHSPAEPRWRILCPSSAPLVPERRDKLMSRLNGIFGGIFASEKLVAQPVVFLRSGERRGAAAEQSAVSEFSAPGESTPIDLLDDLDAGAIGKPNAAGNGANGAGPALTSRRIPCASRWEWRRYCKAGLILESDNESTFRSAFNRASKRLLENDQIGKWDLWVWLVKP